jgi:hypothetical protein
MSNSGRRFAVVLALATFVIVALAWRLGERGMPRPASPPDAATLAAPA